MSITVRDYHRAVTEHLLPRQGALPRTLKLKDASFSCDGVTATVWEILAGTPDLATDNLTEATDRLVTVVRIGGGAKAKKTKIKGKKTLVVITALPGSPAGEHDPAIVELIEQVLAKLKNNTSITTIVLLHVDPSLTESETSAKTTARHLRLLRRAVVLARPQHILLAWGSKPLPLSTGCLLAGLGADISASAKKWRPTFWETTPESPDSPARPSSLVRNNISVHKLRELNAVFR
ncbi:hypothetical protein ACFSSC_09755 [Corynebacterium mendelii]|uniref:Uncharacterized protein n=1 Tax=Corynebacterium mendelii TaxID=2765362 RepID=A0A939IYM0_9CORY|nr:hypothetical protein [Corynebacterium mendelii]MBN9645263.1 hypothetical protein [Corynebacterium mendelii]